METDNTPPSPPLTLTEIHVKGLFGRLDHSIVLSKDSPLTIVVGANGVGKTKVLGLTSAFLRGRLSRLVEYPFDRCSLVFSDGSSLHAERTVKRPEGKGSPKKALRLSHTHGQRVLDDTTVPFSDIKLPNDYEELPPHILRQFTDYEPVQERAFDTLHVSRLQHSLGHRSRSAAATRWLRDFIGRIPAQMIGIDRLASLSKDHGQRDEQFSVDHVAEELQSAMAREVQEYSRLSADLDRTYVDRFLQFIPRKMDPLEPNADIAWVLNDIAVRQKRLAELRLLPTQHSTPRSWSPQSISVEKLPALFLFAEDMEQKLAKLENFALNLEQFLTRINARFTGKQIVADPDDGLLVETQWIGRPSTKSGLSELSSGEQHEVVLLYTLMFRAPRGCLVMIDEPELSLHPAWQRQLTEDLLNIGRERNLTVLIATHSPYIIDNHASLCVELKGPEWI